MSLSINGFEYRIYQNGEVLQGDHWLFKIDDPRIVEWLQEIKQDENFSIFLRRKKIDRLLKNGYQSLVSEFERQKDHPKQFDNIPLDEQHFWKFMKEPLPNEFLFFCSKCLSFKKVNYRDG